MRHLTSRWLFKTYAGHLDYKGKRAVFVHRREKSIFSRKVRESEVPYKIPNEQEHHLSYSISSGARSLSLFPGHSVAILAGRVILNFLLR